MSSLQGVTKCSRGSRGSNDSGVYGSESQPQMNYPGHQGGGYANQLGGYPGQLGGYSSQQSGYPGQSVGYPPQPGMYPSQPSGYPGQPSGYPGQFSGYSGHGTPPPIGFKASDTYLNSDTQPSTGFSVLSTTDHIAAYSDTVRPGHPYSTLTSSTVYPYSNHPCHTSGPAYSNHPSSPSYPSTWPAPRNPSGHASQVLNSNYANFGAGYGWDPSAPPATGNRYGRYRTLQQQFDSAHLGR
ncbi:unnamed protein product [Gongylonema pulchrum]|uniref:CTD domain-containing protein n=1 Tax=Gongylonema pulchrum TaxID=637853 RepID=A0A183DU26_9BILA|nr:unnamed protein product [Gongylonema pulchrum]